MSTWIHVHTSAVVTEISKVGQNCMNFGSLYGIRTKLGLDCPKSCELCKTTFERSDMIHLAFTSKGNKIICDGCLDKARSNGCEIVNMNNGNES